MAETPSFWDTLKNGAINEVTNIARPLNGALGKSIQNVEDFASSRVGQAGQAVVKATSAKDPVTNPATKTTPNIPDAAKQAQAQTQGTLLGLLLALVLIWVLIRSRAHG